MISSPHLAMPLLFDMLRRWSLYLNRCVAAVASDFVDALGCQVPFSLEPIMTDLEGGRYVGPIPPMALRDLVSRSSGRGSSGGYVRSGRRYRDGGGGATATKRRSSKMGGDARMWVRYDMHLPALYLWDGYNTRSILAATVLPTLHGAVLCKNWHLCGFCWEECKRKRSHVPTPLER